MNSAPTWVWTVFGATLLALLIVDLLAHRHHTKQSYRGTVVWSLIWIAAGLVFTVFVWVTLGVQEAQEYLAAYLIEKSLSLDNLFVFLVIFGMLDIPDVHQRTGLSWGILGALVFRAIFIFLGVATLQRWEWLEYVLGLLLLLAAWHAMREDPGAERRNRVAGWLSARLPVSSRTDTSRFLVREDGQWKATPLLVAVLAIEASDVAFAIDSVPAALSVSRNEFVVYSSNAFAILGLRALYLVLEKTLPRLRYLHYGLAAVLAFAGLKMLLAHWVEIPPMVSVAIVAACIGIAAWASVRPLSGGSPTDGEISDQR